VAAKRGEALQSVGTALSIFERIAEDEPIGVSELSRRTKLTKSTVQRCLLTLHAAGWIRPTATKPRAWGLSAKVVALAYRARTQRDLRRAALPAMRAMRDATGESVHLVVREGREAVLVAAAMGPSSGGTTVPRGTRLPLHATANGKSILARLSDDELDAYLAGGLHALTHHTVVDPQALRRELSRVTARGWAANVDELLDGVSSVACAILDVDGRAIAAIALTGPSTNFPREARPKIAARVQAAAREIGARLGARRAIASDSSSTVRGDLA
jgi:IclR family acetate operon transcriptional repressor